MTTRNAPSIEARGIAVITGASSGIGAVYADRLARRGYDLILVARRGDRLDALAGRLRREQKVAVQTVVADLTDPDDLSRVEAIVAGNERITLLVNNAGTAKLGAAVGAGAGDQQAMIALNVTALTRLSLAVLPGFLQRRLGTLINIGSVLSFHTLPISSIYSGTKGYVMNFTRGLQQEVAGRNVFVQLVLPATTRTEIWDNGGVSLSTRDPRTIMSAEDLVDAALAGLDRGETITLPSVEVATLWESYDAARQDLFAASQTGQPASRYSAGLEDGSLSCAGAAR
jgi:short-subunit dehydrogenase